MLFSSFRTVAVIFGIGLILTACVNYGPQARVCGLPVGPGYNDYQLAPNTWKITYTGRCGFLHNRIDLTDRNEDYILLKAAWLCSQNGYPWFTIIARENPPQDHDVDTTQTYSLTVSGFKSKVPQALNSSFTLSSLTQKYGISEATLSR